jgi:antitoxin HigA-1
MPARKMKAIHPGEILLEEFLAPMKLTQYRLAKDINIPARRINEIVHGTRGISADTALRFEKYFGTTATFWMNLQSRYELETEKDAIGPKIQREIKAFARAA